MSKDIEKKVEDVFNHGVLLPYGSVPIQIGPGQYVYRAEKDGIPYYVSPSYFKP